MIDFLINNLDFFLIFIIAVIASIIMARRGQIKKIKEIVLALCVNAEITYGGGTGAIKKASVIEAIYDILPGWAKIFISEKTISDLVEEGKAKMDELANSNDIVNKLLYDVINDFEVDDNTDTHTIEYCPADLSKPVETVELKYSQETEAQDFAEEPEVDSGDEDGNI